METSHALVIGNKGHSMQACNLAQILRLTVVVLAASVMLPDCNAASETQELADVSDMHDGSETGGDFVRFYNVTIINTERLIVYVALAFFVILAAVITIRFARNRRSDSTQSGTDR